MGLDGFHSLRTRFGAVAVGLALAAAAPAVEGWQPGEPGAFGVRIRPGADARLGNAAVVGALDLRQGVRWLRLEDRWRGRTLSGGLPVFRLQLRDGSVRTSADFVLSEPPSSAVRPGDPRARRLADRRRSTDLRFTMRDARTGLRAEWRLEGRDGTAYLRSELELTAERADVPLTGVRLVDLALPGAAVEGETPGSPILGRGWFVGVEHPMSASAVPSPGRATAELARRVPLRRGSSVVVSAVLGLAPEGQVRRAFAAYLEEERARPYAPFLHYNSWYDIGFFEPYTLRDAQNRIAWFGEQLVRQRGVRVSSYLFDDGWDDTSTVWEFHGGFPQGFRPLRALAGEYGGAPGVWLSPWGGYGGPRDRRLAAGQAAGMEIDDQGYALSGPKYFDRFREVCRELVQVHGVNHFKFDGTGSPDKQTPGSAFDSDFAAAIDLIEDLRGRRPELFVNLTTGTWPSPFWTRIADSIWRGGSDHSFAGPGTARQRWITYRDADTYRGVVGRGPLYPLNSVMNHGLIWARQASGLSDDPGGDFDDEIWTYFSTGTQLQEMYISPPLLRPADWDTLAAAAQWSHRHARTLVDVRWVGGDPGQGDVYGWGAWSPAATILTLRNPSDEPQSFALDLAAALEIPGRPSGTRTLRRVNGEGAREVPLGGTVVVDLAPFEVVVWEGPGR